MSVELKIAAGKVGSNLSDFPVFVDLSDMTAGFWAEADLRSDGGNIRVYDDTPTAVPIDLVAFDKDEETGLLVFLAASVLAASDSTWTIEVEDPEVTAPAVDDAIGSEAVWADYEVVTLLGGLTNRTGGSTPSVAVGDVQEFDRADVVLFEETAASPDINGHQGIATDGTHYYVFDSNAIRKYDLTSSLVTENTDPQGDASIASNLTDGFVHEGSIYIGLGGEIGVWDASDLSYVTQFSDDAAAGGHGASQCWNADTEKIVMIQNPSATALGTIDLDGTNGATITLSATITDAQGITYSGGYYWINSDTLDRTYKVATDGTIVSERVWGRVAAQAYEGIENVGDKLLVLTDDGTSEIVRTIEPVYPGLAPGGGAAFVDEDSVITVAVDAPGAQWSMAASFHPADDVQRGIVGLQGGGLFAKAVVDDGDKLGCFDTNDSWVYTSPQADPDKNLFHRVHVVYDGTAARHVYSNGSSKGTDTTITGGGASADLMFIGAGNATATTEGWRGAIAFTYMRSGVLSDDWIAAEYANLSDPRAFYAIVGQPSAGLTRTTAGLVLEDGFQRADSTTLGGDWIERSGDWEIQSGRLVVGAASTVWAENDAAASGESFVQFLAQTSATNNALMAFLRFGWNAGSPNGYALAWNFVSPTVGLVLASAGSLSNLVTPVSKSFGTNTDYPGQLYVGAGVQEGWVDGTTVSGTDTTHDALSGGLGLRRSGGTSSAIRVDDAIRCRSNIIVVEGLPTGYKAKVRNSGGTVVAQATESVGTATINCSRYEEAQSAGTGATELIPLGGWTDLIVTDGDDNIVETYDATGVYPGDEYTFAEPIEGTLAATLEPLTADLSGTIIEPIVGTLNAALEPLTADLSGEVLGPAFSKYDSFCAHTVGTFPAGWEVMFGRDESEFDVAAVASAVDGKVLFWNEALSPGDTVIAPDDLDATAATVDIAARLRMNSSGDFDRIGVAARVSQGGSGANMYYLALFNAGTIIQVRLSKVVDGAATTVFSANFAWGGVGVFNWLRLRVEEESGGGVAIRSAWSRADSGEAMPTTWNDERTDSSSPLTTGRAGMGMRGTLVAQGVRQWDVVAIQTQGDPPPGSTNVGADELAAAAVDDGRAIEVTVTETDPAVTGRTLHRSTTTPFTASAGNQIADLGPDPSATYLDEDVLSETTYYYVTVATDGACGSTSNEASATTGEGADAPDLRVGAITDSSASLTVDPLSEYLSVEFRTYVAGVLIDSAVQTGPERFTRDLSGLYTATEHVSWARVERTDGWSAWAQVTWDTLVFEPIGEAMGCPPIPSSYLWNPDSNPLDGVTRRGLGWFYPLPGEPLRGEAEVILRWYDSGQRFDFYLSDDAGETWSLIAEDVEPDGGDGDGLDHWKHVLDTTLLTDGVDYRLRATSTVNDRVLTSLTFAVDNAEAVRWWTHRGGDPLDGRFGKLWTQAKTGGLFGDPGDPIWIRGLDGGIGALRGHSWAFFADLDVPASLGADVTVRCYVYSGEGGLAGVQGRDDTEGIDMGIGFFGAGQDSQRVGLALVMTNLLTWPIGCCDDLYTSTSGTVRLVGRSSTAQTSFEVIGSLGGEGTVEGGGTMADLQPLRKWYMKSCHSRPRYPGVTISTPWLLMPWRHGNQPGHLPQSARTCGRRYEMYCIRARIEAPDSEDMTRLRVRVRVDGIGVDPPASGYWHSDEVIVMADPMQAGAVGLVSRQLAQGVRPNGARVFMSSSILPLEPGEPLEIEPDEPPLHQPPQEGAPCTLVLQVYDEDRLTVAWEVGTDTDHVQPYLCLPEHYGEQEIDVVQGAATIGQVEVIVVDKNQTVGDQGSGWLTERLSEGGITAIHGRRCRLIRFISDELGWVVIADGPASSPRMDGSFAAYRWTIRDTRETERKVRAFTEPDQWAILPPGLSEGPGWGQRTDGSYLVPAIAGPVSATAVHSTVVTVDGSTRVVFNALSPSDIVLTQPTKDAAAFEANGDFFTPPEGNGVAGSFPNVTLMWRYAGEGEADWRTLEGPAWVGGNLAGLDPNLPALMLTGTGEVAAVVGQEIDRVNVGMRPGEEVPTDSEAVEIMILYQGPTSEQFPYLVDGLTTGELLRQLYDGEHSPRDPVTDEVVPTGIGYDPVALEQMTDPVQLRLTESIDNLRDWTERHIYGPTGWVPALDRDLRISPVSQVPPEDFDGLVPVTNAVTEPTPDWDAGERIVNLLTFKYPRWYPDPDDPTSIDAIVEREVSHIFRDQESIRKHSEQDVTYEGIAFAAVGNEEGNPLTFVTDEIGYPLAVDRRRYVFDRFRNGAQAIEMPVMRSVTSQLRAGDWVTIDLSWLPDYVTKRRGMVTAGQIIAIRDVDCAWRVLLIEEAFPPEPSS